MTADASTRAVADGSVLLLTGGVGGAKLALGMAQVLAPEQLVVLANTGDDFEHLGLHIAPDLDTVTYTLAGLADPERGWGLAGESWRAMAMLERLGGESWFRLGDGDIGLHLWRTRRLAEGIPLSAVTAEACRQLGIEPAIRPMSDDPVRTVIETEAGPLAFQHYFVREQCRPRVRGFRFDGAGEARPDPLALAVAASPRCRAIVIAPSNPFISIDPILTVPGMREALQEAAAPLVAVSPIVGGQALKGPAAKIMHELGLPQSAAAVAGHYGRLLQGFVLDERDEAQATGIAAGGPQVAVCQTVMRSVQDKASLAEAVLAFADRLAGRAG